MLKSRPPEEWFRCSKSIEWRKMEYRGLIPTPPATSSKFRGRSEADGSKKKLPPTRVATWEPTVHWNVAQRKRFTVMTQCKEDSWTHRFKVTFVIKNIFYNKYRISLNTSETSSWKQKQKDTFRSTHTPKPMLRNRWKLFQKLPFEVKWSSKYAFSSAFVHM